MLGAIVEERAARLTHEGPTEPGLFRTCTFRRDLLAFRAPLTVGLALARRPAVNRADHATGLARTAPRRDRALRAAVGASVQSVPIRLFLVKSPALSESNGFGMPPSLARRSLRRLVAI